jgi:hypothetical protein
MTNTLTRLACEQPTARVHPQAQPTVCAGVCFCARPIGPHTNASSHTRVGDQKPIQHETPSGPLRRTFGDHLAVIVTLRSQSQLVLVELRQREALADGDAPVRRGVVTMAGSPTNAPKGSAKKQQASTCLWQPISPTYPTANHARQRCSATEPPCGRPKRPKALKHGRRFRFAINASQSHATYVMPRSLAVV